MFSFLCFVLQICLFVLVGSYVFLLFSFLCFVLQIIVCPFSGVYALYYTMFGIFKLFLYFVDHCLVSSGVYVSYVQFPVFCFVDHCLSLQWGLVSPNSFSQIVAYFTLFCFGIVKLLFTHTLFVLYLSSSVTPFWFMFHDVQFSVFQYLCRSLFVLVGFMFHDVQFSVFCFVDRCLPLSGIFKLLCTPRFQFSVFCFVDHCGVLNWGLCSSMFSSSVFCFVDRCLFQLGLCCTMFSFLCFVLQIVVCSQWGLCSSMFSFLCFVLVDHCLFYSGVYVPRCLVISVFCFVNHCLFQWGLCCTMFSFCVLFCRSLFGLVGFMFLDVQFPVFCFVDHCLVQWGLCCTMFSFLCFVLQIIVCFSGVYVPRCLVFCVLFCRSLFVLVGFMLPDVQFPVFCFVDHCLFQWGLCYTMFSFLCFVLQIIVCFSGVYVPRCLVFCVLFCRSLFVLVGFMLHDVQFSVFCFVDRCLFQWGLCSSMFSFLCFVLQIIVCFSGVYVPRCLVFCVLFCRSLFVLVGFMLHDVQFSVFCFVDHCFSLLVGFMFLDVQFPVFCFVDHCLVQWGLCCTMFSFLRFVLQIIVCFSGVYVPRCLVFCVLFCRSLFVLVGFMFHDVQFSVFCFVDHCLFQWGLCSTMFSFLCFVLQIVVCPFSGGHCVVCPSKYCS